MLVVGWTATSRLAGPAVAAVVSSLNPPVQICSVECDRSETNDSEVTNSDPDAEEIPTVADGRIWIAPVVGSELTFAMSGEPSSIDSSPEPRPAEQA